MKKWFTIIVAMTFGVTSSLIAQTKHREHDCGQHSRNEIGLGVGAIYEISHKEWTSSLHLHYFRTLSPHSKWALGAGIEYLRGDERHIEVGVGVRYEPIENLHISLLPGVTLTDKTGFSVHTEATYDILRIGKIHLGPVIGYAWSKNHSHCSAGVHFAIGF